MANDINDTLTKIVSQNYSYNSQARKYYCKESGTSYPNKADAVEDVINKLSRNYPNQYAEASGDMESLRNTVATVLHDVCTSKKAKRAAESTIRNISGQLSSGLSASVEVNPLWKPVKNFNAVDATWCNGLYIDSNNTLYKKTDTGAMVVVQQVCAQNMDKCVRAVLKVQNIEEPKVFIDRQISALTGMQKKLDAGDNGDKGDIGIQLNRKMGEFLMVEGPMKDITLRQWLGLGGTEEMSIKSMDELSSKVVYKFINDQLPASLMYGVMELAKVYNHFPADDDSGKERKTFDGFTVKTRGNKPITKMAYFENVLSECSEYLNQIDNRPVAATVAGDDTPSFGKFNTDLFAQDAEKYKGLSYEDSWLIRTLLEPMDSDQKKFTCAWYYALFNRIRMVISKCQQDGGGSLKTTVKAVFSKAIKRYYGADLSYPMARGALSNLPARYNDRRQMSLADCLYCPYDEPDQKGPLWEDLKACTGALTREIQIKILYVNPYMAPTDVLFDIGSNKPIYLTDKAAFTRRIAFIRTSAHNTVNSIPKNILYDLCKVDEELTEAQLREFHLLMRIGKKSYEEIVKNYGSIEDAAAKMPSIKSELTDNSPWDEYLMSFYMTLFDENQVVAKFANDALDERLAGYKAKHRTDLAINHLSLINFIKSVHPDNVSKSFKVNKQVVRGWILHKPEIDYSDAEESSFDAIGLDDEGNPIPSTPVPASDYFGGKKYARAKDIPVDDTLNLLGEVANEY